MGKIVAVHGVGQQFKGDAIIHRECWPFCQSGLHLAARELADEREFICPFYGHPFRPAGTLANAPLGRIVAGTSMGLMAMTHGHKVAPV